jgi:hypothetical protein
MKGTSSESAQWATELATKLRFVQSSLADDLTETRQRALQKELAHALKTVPKENRKQCLEALVQQFPIPEPFEPRWQSEQERQRLAYERDAALNDAAEKEASVSQLGATIQSQQGEIQQLATQRDSLIRERDQALAKFSQLTESSRQQMAQHDAAQNSLAAERDQSRSQVENMRANYEAQIAGLQQQLAAVTQERDEQAAQSSAFRASPEAMADALIQSLRSGTTDQTEAVTQKLQESRLLPVGEPVNVKIPQELKDRMKKIAEGRQPDPNRGLRALDVLADFSWNVDQLAWQVWKSVAPKSVIHRENNASGDLRKCLGPYLSGDPEVSTEQLKQVIEKTRKLVAGLLAAMGTVGETYSAKLHERLSPEVIKQLAENEPGVFESLEKKCWRKYGERFIEFNGPNVEKEVLETIRKYTEKLVLGADAVSLDE